MSDDGRVTRLESRVRQAENGLSELGSATNQLAQLQARDGEALSTLRAVAGPEKMQAVTNTLAGIERALTAPIASQKALDEAIDASKDEATKLGRLISTGTRTTDSHRERLDAHGTSITQLQSQAKIIYAILAALGLALLSGLGAISANYLGSH